jgi:alanyl-tRNA synthetase
MYYDTGPEFGCGSPDCRPGCDCDRYLEFWNHVFTELLKTSGTPGTNADGTFEPLAKKNIDTGMGLERLTVIAQGAPSVYETDLFLPIMQRVDGLIQDATGHPADAQDYRRRVIADHSRAVTFMIMDGIYPSNESRGYVLRRLLRRASTFGRLLGIQRPFLHEVVPVVIEVMRAGYPELPAREEQILKILKRDEQQFDETVDQGLARLNAALDAASGRTLAGEAAFRLWSTYGFPLELTREIANERGYTVDEAGYRQALEKDREQARSAHLHKRLQLGDTARLSQALPETGH